MLRIRYLLMSLPVGLLSLGAWAQPAVPASSQPSLTASMLQVLMGLLLVLLVIAGAAWMLRRLSPGQGGAVGQLKVVGSLALGVKERVVLVEVHGQWLVLGVTPNGISHLSSMPRPETVPANIDAGANANFLQALLKYGRK